MEGLAAKHGFDAVYVENVINEFLPDVLLSMDYVEVPADWFATRCFYKMVRKRPTQ